MRNSLSACVFREVLLWIVLQCYWELPLVRSRRADPSPVGGTGRMRLSTITMPAQSPSPITATEIAHSIANRMGDERGRNGHNGGNVSTRAVHATSSPTTFEH